MATPRHAFALALTLAACQGGAPAHGRAPPGRDAAVALAPTDELAHLHDWNAIYADGIGFNHQPNRLLVDAVADVAPGRALDIGMGQGRNTVFLAQAGWDVTGVDTAATGIELAQQQATHAGVNFRGVVADIAAFDLGTNAWDLVALIYWSDRAVLPRIKAALKPGGRVVIEFLHEDSNDYFPHPANGFKAGELEAAFAGFEILRSEVVDDVADFGERPARLVRFVARKR